MNPGSPTFGYITPTLPVYEVDRIVEYHCKESYKLIGTRKSKCLRTGSFSDPVPSCEPMTCSFPGNPLNGATKPTKQTYSINDEVIYSCKPGYTIEGDLTAKCRNDGKFSTKIPKCKGNLEL